MLAWYDFSTKTNLTTSGTAITKVKDLSTNSRDGTVGSSQPPVYATNAIGGLSAAKYGTSTAQLLSNASFSSPTTSGFTVTAVAAVSLGTVSSGVGHFIFGASALIGTASAFAFVTGMRGGITGTSSGTAAADIEIALSGASPDATVTGFLAPDTGRVYVGAVIAPQSTASNIVCASIRVDGGSESGTATSTATSVAAESTIEYFEIGNRGNAGESGSPNEWNGYIGEVRVFTGTLGLTDTQKEEGYLAWKWGLVANLPSNHPYKNAPP